MTKRDSNILIIMMVLVLLGVGIFAWWENDQPPVDSVILNTNSENVTDTIAFVPFAPPEIEPTAVLGFEGIGPQNRQVYQFDLFSNDQKNFVTNPSAIASEDGKTVYILHYNGSVHVLSQYDATTGKIAVLTEFKKDDSPQTLYVQDNVYVALDYPDSQYTYEGRTDIVEIDKRSGTMQVIYTLDETVPIDLLSVTPTDILVNRGYVGMNLININRETKKETYFHTDSETDCNVSAHNNWTLSPTHRYALCQINFRPEQSKEVTYPADIYDLKDNTWIDTPFELQDESEFFTWSDKSDVLYLVKNQESSSQEGEATFVSGVLHAWNIASNTTTVVRSWTDTKRTFLDVFEPYYLWVENGKRVVWNAETELNVRELDTEINDGVIWATTTPLK